MFTRLIFDNIVKLQLGKIMYLNKNGLLPESYSNMLSMNCDIHRHNTRTKNFFRLPYCRTNVRKFSVSFQGLKFFNSLSTDIKNATSISAFTSKLKAFLLA